MSSAAAGGSADARLLVVEDKEMILELLSAPLRFAGFDVVTAVSGAAPVRAVTASRPDLVLLDVMLPDGDGFEVVRRMRSSGPDVPVIFAGRDLPGVRNRIAKPGSLADWRPTATRVRPRRVASGAGWLTVTKLPSLCGAIPHGRRAD
jgi:CheY-like chemotaxis protein